MMKKFQIPQVRFYGRQIADAIEYLNSHGINAILLKPESFLMNAAGDLKLNIPDSTIFYDEWATYDGVPEYLAPEVIRGELHDKAAAMWWTFGCILYELAVGKLMLH